MANTEEFFPDLDEDEGPKKKNKKKKVVKPKPVVEEVVDESTPFKGKPSHFFDMEVSATPLNDPNNPMNYILNDAQWQFVFNYYPMYGAAPYQIMDWVKQ